MEKIILLFFFSSIAFGMRIKFRTYDDWFLCSRVPMDPYYADLSIDYLLENYEFNPDERTLDDGRARWILKDKGELKHTIVTDWN